MILDVGCGDRPEGDVNVDLSIGNFDELYFDDRSINPKLIANFVRADAHFLPFRDNSFSKVCCLHTLEHLMRPKVALDEFKRLANGIVEIRIPVKQHENFQHFFVPKKREYDSKYHKSQFSFKDVRRILPQSQIHYTFFIFYVLKNFMKLRRITPHFLKFLFYTIGSTFFPPIPDIIKVTIK